MQPVCILPLMLTAALLLLPSARAVDGVIDPEDPDPATTITIESSTDSELSGDDLDADEDDVSEFGRAAGVGHSSIAAGKQIPVQRPKVVIKKPILHPLPPPPFLNLGKPKKQPSLAVPLPIGVPPPPIGGPVPIGGFPVRLNAKNNFPVLYCIIFHFFFKGCRSRAGSFYWPGLPRVHPLPAGKLPFRQRSMQR